MCVCADEKYQLYLPRSLARSVQYSKPSRMLRSPRTVHVLGGGALGSLFAAHLSRAGCDTTLLLRPQRITGSHCTIRITEGDSHAGDSAMEQEMKVASSQTVAGSDHDHTTPFDMLVVATKAFDVRNALDGVRARLARTTSVILLCNGPLAVVDELPPHGGPLLVATSTHGAWSRAPRDVHHAGKGDTWVGPLPSIGDAPASTAIAQQFFASNGLGAHEETMGATERRLWLKLAANAVLNPLTALWDCNNGEVLKRAEGRQAARAVCDEIAAVADSLVAATSPPSSAELVDFVHDCAAANASNFSSMCMDVRHGRRTEIEQLNGWIAKKGRELTSTNKCATNEALADAIRALHPSRV